MPSRLTVGLRFKPQESWTGGVYYVRNLISALALLPEPQRPRLVAIGADADAVDELKAATGYADLRRLSRGRLERAPARRFLEPATAEEVAVILMGSPPGLEDRGIHWTPDFQEHRFPQFFDQTERDVRYAHNAERFASHRHLMVSSQDVADDLRRFYPQVTAEVHVLRFATFFEPPAAAAVADARARHGLPARYLLCSNQFWRHKNHALALRALALAPDAPPVAFTGREDDHRDPGYAPRMRALAAELGLGERARFLGFLPRDEQLALMAGALAVVQPSLCEGWSTVVEDAKALGRPVLASDIAVHREQLGPAADLYDPHDPAALAARLARWRQDDPPPLQLDYPAARRRFADELHRMVLAVARDLDRRRVDRLVIKAKD